MLLIQDPSGEDSHLRERKRKKKKQKKEKKEKKEKKKNEEMKIKKN